MKDPLYNPTPWLKYRRLNPKTSKYYLTHLREDLKLMRVYEKMLSGQFNHSHLLR